MTWDTQTDFETNASTTGDPTSRVGAITGSAPGSVVVSQALPDEPAVAIAAGVTHTIALGSNGRAAAVGYDYTDNRCSKIAPWTDLVAVAAGGEHSVGLRADGTVMAVGVNSNQQCDVAGWEDIVGIAAGVYNTVGVKADGTVVATGGSDGQSNVSAWSGIKSVSAGDRHTVGVTEAGTVVAVGSNSGGQCNVSGWTDIKSVAAGKTYTIGLKNDGTIVTTGWPINGEATIKSWTGIVAIATGRDVNSNHTLGLKADGTVVAAGYNWSGQCEVAGWTDVVAIAAGGGFSVGLKSNGEVIGAGNNYYRQISGRAFSDIADIGAGDYVTLIRRTNGTVQPVGAFPSEADVVWAWTDVTKVVAGNSHYAGLKSDGTVLHAGYMGDGLAGTSTWTGISDLAVGTGHTIGIKSDGTAVAVGRNWYGESNVSGWTDIVSAEAGQYHSVGVKSDGSVVMAGHWEFNPIASWTNISAVAVGRGQTLGLRPDGTVISHAASSVTHGEANISGWTDIVQIAAGAEHSVGLKADGTVVAVGANGQGQLNVSGWTDIVEIAAGYSHTVGFKSDGTMVATGYNVYGQSDMTKAVYLNHGARGMIGGAGTETGLRAKGPAGFNRWTGIEAVVADLQSATAVKFAARVSDDGVTWSQPMGRDGEPIDWDTGSGNYLGQAYEDASWIGDLTAIPRKPFIDLVVRLEGGLGRTPELQSATVEYETNVPPTAVDDVAECNEDAFASIDLVANDSDYNEDPLTAVLEDPPVNGAVDISALGVATYTPDPDFNGVDTFTYRASDGVSTSDVATVTITVHPMNDEPPVATDDTDSTNEDVPVIIDVLANDSDPDSVGLVAVKKSDPANGTVEVHASGGFTYTPDADWNGVDTFTYAASDGDFDSNVVTVTVTVMPMPDPPEALDDTGLTDEDTPVALDLVANDSDVDGDTLFVSSLGSATQGLVMPVLTGTVCYGEVTYTPDADFNGTDTFTYLVGDGLFFSGIATATVTVAPVNDAPVFVKGADVGVNEDSGAYSGAWATDIAAGPANEAGQQLTFTVTNSNNGLFSAQPQVAADGSLSFTPAPDAHGTALCTVTLEDDDTAGGPALTHVETFSIAVDPVNDAPVFTKGADVLVDENSGAFSSPWASAISAGPANESGQARAFTVTNSDSALFATQPAVAPNGELTFTPAPRAYGSATCVVTMTDDDTAGGPALSRQETFTITVRRVIYETQLTVTSRSATLAAFDASYVLAGRLSSLGSVSGKMVAISTSTNGIDFVPSGLTALTAADGTFAIALTPREKTHYRVTFAGDAGCEPSASECVLVVPSARISNIMAPAVAYPRVPIRLTGGLAPAHDPGTKPVRIYRWRWVGGKWKSYGYVMATATGNGDAYAASISLPRPGTWRVRAYHPADAGQAATWSGGYTRVTVKTSGDRAVSIARGYLGKPFKWGGSGPKSFDSSGFTRHVYGRMGISLPRTAARQYSTGSKVRRSQLAPGDIVYFNSPRSHVAIYVGNGKIIGPSRWGRGVAVRRMYWTGYKGAIRPTK